MARLYKGSQTRGERYGEGRPWWESELKLSEPEFNPLRNKCILKTCIKVQLGATTWNAPCLVKASII